MNRGVQETGASPVTPVEWAAGGARVADRWGGRSAAWGTALVGTLLFLGLGAWRFLGQHSPGVSLVGAGAVTLSLGISLGVGRGLLLVVLVAVLSAGLPGESSGGLAGLVAALAVTQGVAWEAARGSLRQLLSAALRLACPLLLTLLQAQRGGELAGHFTQQIAEGAVLALFAFAVARRELDQRALFLLVAFGALLAVANYAAPPSLYGEYNRFKVLRYVPGGADPNYYAESYVLPLAAGLALLLSQPVGAMRLVLFVSTVAILVGVLGTGSRTGLLFSLVMIAVMLLQARGRQGPRARRSPIGWLVLASVVVLTALPRTPLGTRLSAGIGGIASEFSADVGLGRGSIWRYYLLEILPRSPIIGSGFSLSGTVPEAHNTPIQVLGDFGIAGVLVLVVLFRGELAGFFTLIRRAVVGGYLNLEQLFLVAALCGVAVANLFLTGYGDRPAYIVLGLGMGLLSRKAHTSSLS